MVNYLQQLEELHLWSIRITGDGRLSMPNLKTFKTIQRYNFKITLDAPQLINLSLTTPSSVKLVHPETIETLEVRYSPYSFCDSNIFPSFLISLTGLKYLLLEDCLMLYPELAREQGVLKSLSGRLKEIHFFGFRNFDRALCQAMSEPKEQASEMRIYFGGLEIDCLRDLLNGGNKQAPDSLNKRGLATRDQLDFYLSNSSMLSKMLPLHEVNYNLVENLSGSSLNIFSPGRLPILEMVRVKEPLKDEPLASG